MKTLLKIFCVFLLSSPLYALTCSSTKTVNLSSPTGPLSNLRVTDQNGLGICNIEQLHKMLKARLPNHPDLSRIQLAINDKDVASNDPKSKAIRWMDKGEVGGTYLDGGNSCASFNNIKGRSICLAKDDRFEQITRFAPEIQENIIENLSLYFDHRKQNFSFPEFAKTQSPFSNFETLDKALKNCPLPNSQVKTLKNAYIAHIEASKKELSTKFESALAEAKKMPLSSFEMGVSDYLSAKSYSEFFFNKFKYANSAPFSPTAKALSFQVSLANSNMFFNKSCIVREYNFNRRLSMCLNPNMGDSSEELVSLLNYGLNLNEIVKLLGMNNADRDTFFMNAFECSGKKELIPSTITCKTVDLVSLAKVNKTESAHIKNVTNIIDSKLQAKTPLGISVCTRFFKNPKAKTLNVTKGTFSCGNKSANDYSQNEGSHAVTLIGKRCKNGQEEYLIQNSWGNGCFYSEEYECTHEGGFWAPADVVVNNIRNLNYLE